MKHTSILLLAALMLVSCGQRDKTSYPWDNGRLQVDATGHFLQHENGEPFFWLGETGWLLPERLNREDAEYYLEACRQAGYNVVQVQTVNGVPATNCYGQLSMPEGFDFSHIDCDSSYGYWDHMDYIVETAASKGIYIGMVCIWGGLVKKGLMSVEDAKAYGTFLGERYKDHPNIIWFIGGDIYGDVKTEEWETLARSIKAVDKNHLMTFHPFGRTLSAVWFHQADWLDFNMFQSGHRNYGLSLKKERSRCELLPDSCEEDNWRYVEIARNYQPSKPVIDGEPSYEGIPYGLHDFTQPFWQDYEVRRYAYWSVFAGAFGHTYGNSAIMQMHPDGGKMGAYGCTKYWKDALKDPGFNQMQYLKKLILDFPYYDRVPDQSVILGENASHHKHLLACRGNDYILVYNYAAVPMSIDLSKIAGKVKKAWWYNPTNGVYTYIGEFSGDKADFAYEPEREHDDRVLVIRSKDAQAAATVQVTALKCENRVEPQGVGLQQQRFSWQLQSQHRGLQQEAYRIMVASSKDLLDNDIADVWDSKKQRSEASVLVPYAGPALKTSSYYYWKVQVWTNATAGYSESPVASFLTALETDKDWSPSYWIGYENAFPWDDESTHARLSARYLRKEFKCKQDQPIRQAVLHIAGLGLYELWLNGQKVGDQVMAPVPTDFRKHIMYNTFDVTDCLQAGDNAIGVILGNGRYYAMRQNYKPHKWTRFGYPKLRLLLTITYADGRRQTLGSDQSWLLSAQGPIVANNEFDGEEYDARKEFDAWTLPAYQPTAAWIPAQRAAVPQAALVVQPCENMKVMATISPKSIVKLDDNTYIMDMGQNMAGWIKMRVKGPRGQQVRLRFAEALLPDGHLSMANLRDALVTDIYTLKGDEKGEVWAPRFVTHGFQYVEISGYPGEPKLEDFTGEFVCDEMADLGSFETSSPVLNAVYRNAYWGIRGNYKGMPVDCPQRNERMPWLGDRVMGSYGESFLFDNAAFYAKWMGDIRDAQRWDGAIPDVAPAYWNYYSDDVTWPAAMFFTCDMLYRQYGDIQPIAQHFDAMKLFMDYMRKYYYNSESGLIKADKYGDWCMPTESLEIIHSKAPDRLTDGKLIATAYFYALYQLMIKFADLLDRSAEVQDYAAYAEGLKAAFQRNFFDQERHCYSNNTVTANILALAMDFVPDEEVDAVCENIRAKIMDEYHGTMATGIIGNQWLWRELTHHGYGDIAWLLATTTDYPSFGYMVSQGATTIWELWNGDKANPKMNSRNHVMQLGDLLIWCYEDLAGIKSDSKDVAFKKIVMKPAFYMQDLDYVKAAYATPYGLVQSYWQKIDGHLRWRVTVPANTSAEVHIPLTSLKELRVNAGNYASAGVSCLSKDKDGCVLALPSGSYLIEW